MKAGFLDGSLYPEGSTEAAPSGWRKGSANSVQLTIEVTDAAYVIIGQFREAGRFLGKEDFNVERLGLALRVRGSDTDPDSLVSGLDTTVSLPPDASNDGMSADFTDSTLRIVVPRLRDGPLADLVAGLSLAEAQAVGAALERGLESGSAPAAALAADDGAKPKAAPPAAQEGSEPSSTSEPVALQ